MEAAGVERFFHSIESITYMFSIAYKTAKMPKMPVYWYSLGTVFRRFSMPIFAFSSECGRRRASCSPSAKVILVHLSGGGGEPAHVGFLPPAFRLPSLPQGWYSLGTALSVRNLPQFSYKFRLQRICAIQACAEATTLICEIDRATNSVR